MPQDIMLQLWDTKPMLPTLVLKHLAIKQMHQNLMLQRWVEIQMHQDRMPSH